MAVGVHIDHFVDFVQENYESKPDHLVDDLVVLHGAAVADGNVGVRPQLDY